MSKENDPLDPIFTLQIDDNDTVELRFSEFIECFVLLPNEEPVLEDSPSEEQHNSLLDEFSDLLNMKRQLLQNLS